MNQVMCAVVKARPRFFNCRSGLIWWDKIKYLQELIDADVNANLKSVKENSFTGLKTYTSPRWSKIIRPE